MRGVAAYVPVAIGLLVGLILGGLVADTDPAILGWIFGAGAGLMFGAFVAALATNEPLVGRGGATARSITYPGESPPRPDADLD